MSALTGPASPDVASLAAYVGVLPQAAMLTLLILLFEKVVARSVDGPRARLLSRCLDIAIAPLAMAGLLLAAAHIARV